MLRQDINLFKPLAAPPPPKSFLSWKLFLFSNIAFATIFFIIYLLMVYGAHSLRSQKTALLTQSDQLQKKFFAVKKTYPAIFFSENVTQSINELKVKLEQRAKILETLSKHVALSQVLTVLTKVIVPNVWLTDITITNGGDNITLKGKSIRMDSIQTLLGNLLREKIFSDYSLNVKNIENLTNDIVSGNLEFEVTIAKKIP